MVATTLWSIRVCRSRARQVKIHGLCVYMYQETGKHIELTDGQEQRSPILVNTQTSLRTAAGNKRGFEENPVGKQNARET